MNHRAQPRRRRIILDIHNLSIHPTELRKTGIQEVSHALLLASREVRAKWSASVDLICLPAFWEAGFDYRYAPALQCKPELFAAVEDGAGVPGSELWGFDFRARDFTMTAAAFAELTRGADWWITTCQFDVRRILEPLARVAPDIRFAQVFHDLIPVLMPDLVVGELREWFRDDYLPSIGLTSSLVVGNSRHSALDMLSWLRTHGYNGPEVYAAPFPTAAASHGPSTWAPADVAKKYGVKTERFVLIIGSTDPRKNVARMLEAFVRACLLRPALRDDLTLLIVGPKVWRTEDITSALRRGRESGCRMLETGYVSDDDLRQLVAASAGVLMPSRYEGFGLPLALAQGQGTPVVTCINSSLAEVTHARATYAVPYSVDSMAMALLMMVTSTDAHRDQVTKAKVDPATVYGWTDYLEALLSLVMDFPVPTERRVRMENVRPQFAATPGPEASTIPQLTKFNIGGLRTRDTGDSLTCP